MGILSKQYPAIQFNADSEFENLDDSQALMDVILQIEDATAMDFDPTFFDLDASVTPMRLALAFKFKAP